MIIRITVILFTLVCSGISQSINKEDLNANVQLPRFNARLSVGFNYDLLRTPTDVNFEYPRGFMGFNIPMKQTVNLRDFINYVKPAVDSVFNDSTIFSNGAEFKPEGSASQNPNLSVSVDVPMMGGVASFSTTQNCFLTYENALGNPNIYINPDSLAEGMKLLLRGTVNVPLSVSMSWETMTFGYAYRINKLLTMAFNIHRHLFVLDVKAKIDADILGKFSYSSGDNSGAGLSIDHVMDYSSNKVYGRAAGHYDAEVWTPTIGLKAWRFTMTSRFGFKTKAHGSFYAQYSLPFFIDPRTFKTTVDFNNKEVMNDADLRQNLFADAVDSVTISTKKMVNNSAVQSDLEWQMPTGLTFDFDIIPEHLRLSYTKIFGEVAMKLDRIAMEQVATETGDRESVFDSLSIDFGAQVDNVIMLQCKFLNSFINLGVFGMDFRVEDQKNLLGKNMPYMHMGKAAMLPVLNLGSAIGTKLQLLLELDVLPLPALKTGVFYYF